MQKILLSFSLLCFSLALEAQELTNHIVIDQFGYLPDSRKIAVIRDPQVGFDEAASFSPGATYALINSSTGEAVFSGAPESWKAGATDASSGDKAWWFDFSAVAAVGTYHVLDIENNVRSFDFDINPDVYNEVLKHAMRTFFYQRAGFEKKAAFAGAEWADAASHLGPLQDKNVRLYNDKNNAAKERDVSGGWYDAGDYNKYTSWTANYVVDFMRAYLEAPSVWSDDYNIPESGNGIPDILDEAKWGIDHLLRMQKSDGSVLSIVGLAHGSPPSSATGPSYYGAASTSATLNTAGAFAIASKVYAARGMKAYADTLKARAIKAWIWAEANPAVIFKNNDAASGTAGLGAGQQETDDYGRLVAKMRAACFLFEITGEEVYKAFFDNNYTKIHMMEWPFAYPFEADIQQVLLHYSMLPEATAAVANAIRTTYKNEMNNGIDNFPAYIHRTDPYLAHLQVYTWGSNSVKALQGLMYTDLITYEIDADLNADALNAAAAYVHYIHGVNPLNLVYLSNMNAYGADNSVNEFYHSWFTDGSTKWDRVGESTYGPAPGFLAGGANPSYDWDGCCPDGCGGNADACYSESLMPPKGQPAQKSYKDFNTSWPINSWSVTENSNGYQINYIRLLSKFITARYDCSGTKDGTASYDVCNRCSGGITGVAAITDPEECTIVTSAPSEGKASISVFPNPTEGRISIRPERYASYNVTIVNLLGQQMLTENRIKGQRLYDISSYPAGIYVVKVERPGYFETHRIVKR